MPRKATKAMTPDLLRLEYVPIETATAWERNPKRHDIGAIWRSIQQHGFRDPPAFDAKLNGGKGGIVEGNGRSHVLREMQMAGEPAPRGIGVNAEDVWLMPVLFGVDADSERAAEAYGIDHNNLVLSGGDFRGYDLSKLWDQGAYTELLADLAQSEALPVSVDGEDVDDLIGRLAGDGNRSGGYDSFEQTQHIKKSGSTKDGITLSNFGVLVLCEGESDQAEIFERLRDEGYEVRLQGTKPAGVKR